MSFVHYLDGRDDRLLLHHHTSTIDVHTLHLVHDFGSLIHTRLEGLVVAVLDNVVFDRQSSVTNGGIPNRRQRRRRERIQRPRGGDFGDSVGESDARRRRRFGFAHADGVNRAYPHVVRAGVIQHIALNPSKDVPAANDVFTQRRRHDHTTGRAVETSGQIPLNQVLRNWAAAVASELAQTGRRRRPRNLHSGRAHALQHHLLRGAGNQHRSDGARRQRRSGLTPVEVVVSQNSDEARGARAREANGDVKAESTLRKISHDNVVLETRSRNVAERRAQVPLHAVERNGAAAGSIGAVEHHLDRGARNGENHNVQRHSRSLLRCERGGRSTRVVAKTLAARRTHADEVGPSNRQSSHDVTQSALRRDACTAVVVGSHTGPQRADADLGVRARYSGVVRRHREHVAHFGNKGNQIIESVVVDESLNADDADRGQSLKLCLHDSLFGIVSDGRRALALV